MKKLQKYFLGFVLLCSFGMYLFLHSLYEHGDLQLGDGKAHYVFADVQSYIQLVEQYGGHLETIRQTGVAPGIYSENLPHNLSQLPIEEKTSAFISILLPNVVAVNQEILAQRTRLKELLAKRRNFCRLTYKEQWWLNRLARRYGCAPDDDQELLIRVDTVPTALAVAQGIDESGWGTSRFALAGNALYGQRLSASATEKFIKARQADVKVAAFDSIYDATRQYMHNLNTVWAYEKFRSLRGALREQGEAVTGYELAGGLERYSAMGKRYIQDLRFLIRHYGLEKLNGVRLDHQDSPLLVQFVR